VYGAAYGAAYAGAYGEVMSGAYRPRFLLSVADLVAADLSDADLASSAAAAKHTIIAMRAKDTWNDTIL